MKTKNEIMSKNKIILLALAVIFTLLGHILLTKAAVLDVGTEAELVAAIANGDSVRLTADITLTAPIDLPAGYNGSITSADANIKKIRAGGNFNRAMFNMSNATLSVDNIDFDGANSSKIFDVAASNITFQNSVIQNGNSQYTDENAEGGAIRQLGGNITVNSSKILNNNSIRNAGHDADSKSHGGAFYVLSGTLTVNDSVIEGNKSGQNALDPAGGFIGSNGGAVYAERSTVNFNNVTASNNSANKVNDIGGFKGGVIYGYDRSTVNVSNSTFNVAAGFNIGGAIALESSATGNISDSNFNIKDLGDLYGISGGAISSASSNLTVSGSNFVNSYTSANKKSKLAFAGGFIDIIGSGSFVLKNSNLTGPGRWWQGPSIATYGAAIAFETGSTATGLIENTLIQNVTSDEGGAISISTRKGEVSSVNLEVKNSTIQNVAGGVAGYQGYGGAIFIGPGNTVLVNGGIIKDAYSLIGGAIYNEGTATITGGADINNNRAYTLGSGIYNDGVLTVDNATIKNNYEHPDINPSGKNPKEYSGNNIYANKDVTITPNAVFDDYDVRVLDGQSAVILTGSLNKKINVSISEVAGGRNPEPQYRHIGYVVAKGNGSYEPVKTDAQFLNYVVLNGADISDYEDHTSVGKWDYVLNPIDKTVVVGQRAKMIYHANHPNAKFADNELTKTQLYDFYESTPTAMPLSNPNQMTRIDEEPTDEGYRFVNWYKPAVTDADVSTNRNAGLFDFANEKFVSASGEVTSILNPNIINVYAGWEKIYKVTYRFEKAPGIIPALPADIAGRIGEANFEKDKANGTTVIPNTTNNPQIDLSNYADSANRGTWRFISWDASAKTITNRDIEFVGTWTFINNTYNKTHEFIKGSASYPDLPSQITDRLLGKDERGFIDGEVLSPNSAIDTGIYKDNINNGTWSFETWDFDTQTVDGADVHFIGKWKFAKDKAKVEHFFESEDPDYELPQEVLDLLPNDYLINYGELAVPSQTVFRNVETQEGTWTFVAWDYNEKLVDRPVTKFIGVWRFRNKTATPADPIKPQKPDPEIQGDPDEPDMPDEATPSSPDRPLQPDMSTPSESLPNTSGGSGGGFYSSVPVRRIIINDPVKTVVPILKEAEVEFVPAEKEQTMSIISRIPKTSDERGMAIYLMLLLLSLSSLPGIIFIKRMNK